MNNDIQDKGKMVKFTIKIGGSILVDEDSYRLQAKRLEQVVQDHNPSIVYVVVSAKKGETDRLITEVSNPKDEEKLRKALDGECRFPEYDNPIIAARLLQGEIDSVYRLKHYLPSAGVVIQGPHFPIVANSSYFNAIIDLEESLQRARYLERPEQIVIIPGFGAVNPKGKKVLLGRNSSDLVAAMIARLANVDKLIYLKDVDGVYRNFGQNNQEQVSEMGYVEAKRFGKVIDKRALDLSSGSKLEMIIGHHEQLHELAKPNSLCGTRIRLDAPFVFR